jgi:hypothetical protein
MMVVKKANKLLKDSHDATWYVPFTPEQVKSAIGNAGTFDPKHPDITKATLWQRIKQRFGR